MAGSSRVRSDGRLTALAASRAVMKRGMYGDGRGLYLQIAANGSRSWIFRYQINGRTRHLGLGPLHDTPLALARERAADARRMVFDGTDPIEAKRSRKAALALEAAKAITFDQAAEAYIRSHAAGWRNAKHAAQWTATLRTYVSPAFGQLAVAAVDTALVLKVLEQIWATKPVTAGRVRGRIEAILDWAKARGYREGENPARWRGHLDHLLPARSKVRAVKHHAALPYADIAAFMAALRRRVGTSARALEFTILTAARTGETLGAAWPEVDCAAHIWTIPAERTKAKRPHRVPLSDAALALLDHMPRDGEFVFAKRDKPLPHTALLTTLHRMGRGDLTAHGFRSTFRDWCAERTNYPREVAEAALAHVLGDKTEAAYLRSDHFEKRARLMAEWANYCNAPTANSANVVSLRSGN